MTLGGAAEVVAAHCPNEWPLDPAVCCYNRPTYASASRTMAFTRSVLRQRLTVFISEYYQTLTATHLPTLKGWKVHLTTVCSRPRTELVQDKGHNMCPESRGHSSMIPSPCLCSCFKLLFTREQTGLGRYEIAFKKQDSLSPTITGHMI